MAKRGMTRPGPSQQPHNRVSPVPEAQGRSKREKAPASPIIAGAAPPGREVCHTVPHTVRHGGEKPISAAYPVIDNDLARDNVENHIPAADLQDL